MIGDRLHTRSPDWWVGHVRTWRLHDVWHPVFAAAAGAVLSGAGLWGYKVLVICVACCLGWLAGMYAGDFFGRGKDAMTKPHRPMPAGLLSAPMAVACTAVLSIAGSLIIVVLNWHDLLIVGVTVAAYAVYNSLLKAYGVLGDLMAAVSTSGNVFLVGTAVGASWPPLALLPAYLALFAQAIVYNVFFALTDIDGDRSVGWKTLPVRRGVDTTIMVLTGLLMVQLGCAAIVPLWIGHTTALPAYLTLVAVSALLSAGAVRTLVLASRPLRRVVALRAVEYCLLDRVVLPAAFVILVDGVMPVGAVLLVALVSTWWASRTLLYRHEIGRHRPSGDGPPSGAVPRVVG